MAKESLEILLWVEQMVVSHCKTLPPVTDISIFQIMLESQDPKKGSRAYKNTMPTGIGWTYDQEENTSEDKLLPSCEVFHWSHL